MNTIYFSPISLSQLLKEKGVEVESKWHWARKGEYFVGNEKVEAGHPVLTDEIEQYDFPYEFLGYGYNIGELPDVFRQVFIPQYFDKEMEWLKFCKNYFKDPAKAWETLEKTIRELK